MQVFKNYNLKIRNRIKKYRKQNGLSQEQLAELIDCSREHIARIENGKINLGLDNFIRLATIFHISLDELAGFSPDFDKNLHIHKEP